MVADSCTLLQGGAGPGKWDYAACYSHWFCLYGYRGLLFLFSSQGFALSLSFRRNSNTVQWTSSLPDLTVTLIMPPASGRKVRSFP